MKSYCCNFMKSQIEYTCEQHPYPCPDILIVKYPDGHRSLQSPNASYQLNYCPSCGVSVERNCDGQEN